MANACNSPGPMEGGIISNSTIINSTLVNPTITNGELNGCRLVKLESIDDASVKVIVDALAKLDDATMTALVTKLLASIKIDPADVPATTDEDAIPTTMYGDRSVVLGGPDSFVKARGFKIPLYK